MNFWEEVVMLTLKKYIFTFIVLFGLILTSYSMAVGEEISNKLNIRADGAILIDAQSGKVLYEFNGYRRMHPASLTKVMTALLAIEKGNLNSHVTISEGPQRIYIGSIIRLKKGEIISLGDLVKAALIVSANDSTVAISEYIGGTQDNFIRWMNQKAYTLGAYNTRFINTNGYSKPNHLTTPYDLALISRYAMNNKTFAKIVSTKEAIIYRTSFRGTKKVLMDYPLRNTNRLLSHSSEFVGVKTGTTTRAGGCLISAMVKNGQMLIAVVMRSSRRYEDSLALFNYGFNNYRWVEKLHKGQVVMTSKVKKGKTKQVKIIAQRDLFAVNPITENDNTRLKILAPKLLKAPLAKGKIVGRAILYQNGKVLDQINLVTSQEVLRK